MRVGQPRDVELEVDAVAGGLEVAPLDLELLVEHLDRLDEVGRDRTSGAATFLMASSRTFSASVGGAAGVGRRATPSGAAGRSAGAGDRPTGPMPTTGTESGDPDRGNDPIFGHGRDVGLFLKGRKGMPDHIARRRGTQVRPWIVRPPTAPSTSGGAATSIRPTSTCDPVRVHGRSARDLRRWWAFSPIGVRPCLGAGRLRSRGWRISMHTIGVLLLAAATAGDGFGYSKPGRRA